MSLEYFDKNALLIIKDDYPIIPQDVEAGIMFEQDVYSDNFDILMEKWIELIEKNNIDTQKSGLLQI